MKYTPEHMHCGAHFVGFGVAPNTPLVGFHALGRDCALSQQKTAEPGARAPPSPAGVRRAFPRRVPDRVRRALESDDEDAWRLE